MGKRKSRKPVPKKTRKEPPLDTVFNCPYCNHSKCIRVQMKRKEGVGKLGCWVCGATFSCKIGALSATVDIYAAWIDECCEVNRAAELSQGAKQCTSGAAAAATRSMSQDETDSNVRARRKRQRVEALLSDEEQDDRGSGDIGKGGGSAEEDEHDWEEESQHKLLRLRRPRLQAPVHEDDDEV